MPEEIIGLDISSDCVAAVQVTRGLKGHHVTACNHVMIEEAGGMDETLKSLFEPLDLQGVSCTASIPVDHVSYRNLKMPFRDERKIRQTLVFELETMVPVPVEDLIVDFKMVDRSDNSEILAASVKRADISEYLAHLQSNGVDPGVIDIGCIPTLNWLVNQEGTPDNGLFLDVGHSKNTMFLYINKRLALIRTFPSDGSTIQRVLPNETGSSHTSTEAAKEIESSLKSLCAYVQNTLHAFAWQTAKTVRPEKVFIRGRGRLYPDIENALGRLLDLPVERIQVTGDPRIHMEADIARAWNPALMDNALALAVGEAKQRLGFNFRRDEFQVKKAYFGRMKEFRKVAAVLAVILFLVGVDLGIEYFSLKKQYKTLDQQIMAMFRQTFPDVKRIVDPVQQMRVKINEIKKTALSLPGIGTNTQVLDLLKDVSSRVPESADIHVARLVVDPDAVLVSGETDTFNTVDTIKKGLEPSSYFYDVTITSANLDRSGNRVQFEMKLKRAK
jgi:type II secretory pathway component PulL